MATSFAIYVNKPKNHEDLAQGERSNENILYEENETDPMPATESITYEPETIHESAENSIEPDQPIENQEIASEIVDETVYATMNVNIRQEPDDTSVSVGLLIGGDSIKRTEILSNNWSKVLYGNEEFYIHSEYLTKIKPEKQETEEIDKNSGWVCLGEFKITSYCGDECCNGQWAWTTSTGVSPKAGRTIAVAPWIIPYGTAVMIDGLDNIYIAEDTGGFANRNDHQIDLFASSHERATEWGVQYRKVWVKK